MIRYDGTGIQNRWDGKRVYKTTVYPIIPVQDTDIQVVTNTEDYLDAMALKYYGDPSLYWIIALANNLGKGRLSVPAGITIRIPVDTSSILSEFNQLNS
jgi:hypothetical protein